MNWYKIENRRINLSRIDMYKPVDDLAEGTYSICLYNGDSLIYITFITYKERDEELRKLDEALENGLYTLSEFKLP